MGIQGSYGFLWRWNGSGFIEIQRGDISTNNLAMGFDAKGVLYLGTNGFELPGMIQNGNNRLINNTIIPMDTRHLFNLGGGGNVTTAINFAFGKEGEVFYCNKQYDSNTAAWGNDYPQIGGLSIEVDYQGNADCYPEIVVYGPCHLMSVINHTTGGEIFFQNDEESQFNIGPNEEVHISLEGGMASAWSTLRGNLNNFILYGGSNLSDMYMRPGINYISMHADEYDSGSRVFIRWRNKYLNLDSTLT
jgi:hypothetical protein